MPRAPKQPSLFRPAAAPRPRKSSPSVTHDARNRESVTLILADAARYGGPEALPVIWARAVAEKGSACS